MFSFGFGAQWTCGSTPFLPGATLHAQVRAEPARDTRLLRAARRIRSHVRRSRMLSDAHNPRVPRGASTSGERTRGAHLLIATLSSSARVAIRAPAQKGTQPAQPVFGCPASHRPRPKVHSVTKKSSPPAAVEVTHYSAFRNAWRWLLLAVPRQAPASKHFHLFPTLPPAFPSTKLTAHGLTPLSPGGRSTTTHKSPD